MHPHAPAQAIYIEFIFNLMETFRSPVLHPIYRPNGGFLAPEEWPGAMEAAGFVDVRMLPDIPTLRALPPLPGRRRRRQPAPRNLEGRPGYAGASPSVEGLGGPFEAPYSNLMIHFSFGYSGGLPSRSTMRNDLSGPSRSRLPAP